MLRVRHSVSTNLSCETVVPLESPCGAHSALSLAMCSTQQSCWANQMRKMHEAEWEELDRTELQSNHITYLLFDLKQIP